MAALEFHALASGQAAKLSAIEAESAPYPWSTQQYFDSLSADGNLTWGAYQDQGLVGFAVFQTVLDESSLLNIAVARSVQQQGVGRELLRFCLQTLQRERGVAQCILEVRVSNLAAQRLYRSVGFAEIARRRDYYRAGDMREDALVMQRVLCGDSNE